MGKIIHNSDGSVTRTSSTGRKFTYKFQQGGETESQKQKRLYEEMQKLPEPKISDDTHYDETRKEWVPSAKFKSDTLFVSNPNDPRLQSYNDSLTNYNFYQAKIPPGAKEVPIQQYIDARGKQRYIEKFTGSTSGHLIEPIKMFYKATQKSNGDLLEHYIPRFKKPTQPVAYKEGLDLFKTTGRIREGYKEFAYRDTNGNYNTHYIPIEKVINFNKQEPTQISQSTTSLKPAINIVSTAAQKQKKSNLSQEWRLNNGKYEFRNIGTNHPDIEWKPGNKIMYDAALKTGAVDTDLGNNLGYRKRFKLGGSIVRPQYGGGTLSTVDTRQLNPITGNKLKATQRKNHTGIDIDLVEQLVKGSVERGLNPNTTLAIGLQETGLGTVGKTFPNQQNMLKENPLRYHLPNSLQNANIEQSLDALKDKYALAKRLNKTGDADSIQAWNGYGKVYAASYDNIGMYGIPYQNLPTLQKQDYDLNAEGTETVPNGKYKSVKGIDMNSNPVYGKTIASLRDSVIMQSPQIQEIVSKYYNPNANSQTDNPAINRIHRNIPQRFGGKLKKYKNAGRIKRSK